MMRTSHTNVNAVARLAAGTLLGLALSVASAAEPSAAFIRVDLATDAEYWLFQGCPDDKAAFRAFADLLKGAELRDALPSGAVAEKERLTESDVIRVLIVVPEHFDRADVLAPLTTTCARDDLRCAILIRKAPPTSEQPLAEPPLSSMPHIPQFKIESNEILATSQRALDENWPVKLSAGAVAIVFDAHERLRWLIRLPSDEILDDTLTTLLVLEAARRPTSNMCEPAPGAKDKKTLPGKPPGRIPPATKTPQREASASAPAHPDSVRLAGLGGLAYSLATRERVSLQAAWLQQLNRDRPVLLYVWGSWCEPCRDDWRPLQNLHSKYGAQAYFLGLALEEFPTKQFGLPFEKVKKALARDARPHAKFVTARNTYVIPTATENNPLDHLGTSATSPPFFALFDRAGRLVFKMNGRVSLPDAQQALGCALQAGVKPTTREVASALCTCRSKHSRSSIAWTVVCDVR